MYKILSIISIVCRRWYCRILVILFLLNTQQIALSQGISTEGKEFWVGYLSNWLVSGNPVILELYISADDTARGVVSIPRLSSFIPIKFEVYPNVTRMIRIPTNLGMATGTNIIENKGILIETDNPVSVYAMNKRQYSADMTVVLPTYSLGNNYFVMSHWESGNRNNNENSDSEFLILAITDHTEIEITPTCMTKGGNPANVPFRVTLQKGQTYQVQARCDLTGTQIRATSNSGCQNFAVFSGNMYTQVGECNVPNGHDHLYAQMYPANTLGKEFIVVPLENRFGGDIIKFLATQNNTTIHANGTTYNLNAGDFVKILSASILNVSSDKPISVGQFSRTMDCDGTLGDPFLIPISPNEQMLKKITFNAPSIATLSSYSLNMVTKTSSINSIRLDGTAVGNRFTPIPSTEYAYARLSISGGNHTIRSDDGFIAYVYGFGHNESFGYATGASLGNLNIDLLIYDQHPATPVDSLCLGSDIYFKPNVDSIYRYFEYDFGDGNKLYVSKDTIVSHKYAQPGEYLVTLTASTGVDDCSGGNEEKSLKVIRVIEPFVSITGPRSVCPNTAETAYLIKNNLKHLINWKISGGEIHNIMNDSILIDWGKTNASAGIHAVATNRYGCTSDTISYPVKINVQLEPEAPSGPDTLCSNHITMIPYTTWFTAGSTYNWYSDVGEIVSGNGSNKVMADWKTYGSGNIWYHQYSITDTICDGISDTLSVFIQRNPSEMGRIISADTIFLGEKIDLSIEADTLYRFVNWKFGDGTSMDTVPAHVSYEHTFACDGIYKIYATAYDTGTICSETRTHLEKTIYVIPPKIEIIHVTVTEGSPQALEIGMMVKDAGFYQKNLYLYRRQAGTTDWQLVANMNPVNGTFIDANVEPEKYSYEYKIETNTDCSRKIASRIHQSILLQAEQDEETARISWNDYQDWKNGVDRYEVWVSVDNAEFTLLEITSGLSLLYSDNDAGFDHCFRITAFEKDGSTSSSLSNTSCVSFVPEIKTYNVFTPNQGDQINEFFTIDNIEHYPNSRLTILNRYGDLIYEKTGYRNNWGGQVQGKLLPSGNYFFELELNEPRNPQQRFKGFFSILY